MTVVVITRTAEIYFDITLTILEGIDTLFIHQRKRGKRQRKQKKGLSHFSKYIRIYILMMCKNT